MGFVDRGGGREAKGASLRRSKKNPGAAAARKASATKQQQQPTTRVPPTPPPFLQGRQHIDAAVAILARRLEVDRDALMGRAAQESGVAAALTWCVDFGRQEALIEFCRQHNTTASAASAEGDGRLYCLVGVHVNNVDRMHKKQQETWVESVASWGKHPEVLGVLSGLNLYRDSGTHFAQEWLLEQLWRVAGSLQVPLVLHLCHDSDAGEGSVGAASYNLTVERSAELLAELITRDEDNVDAKGEGARRQQRQKPTAIVIYNGLGAVATSAALRTLVRRHAPAPKSSSAADAETTTASGAVAAPPPSPPIYILLTAHGLTGNGSLPIAGNGDAEAGDAAAYNPLFVDTLRNHVSPSQILIGTGSPWNTPQNIPDAHVRTLPNEPANYKHVVSAIAAALTGEAKEQSGTLQGLYATAQENFLRLFFSSESSSQANETEKEKDEEDASGEVEARSAGADSTRQARAVHFGPAVGTSKDVLRVAPDSVRYYLCLKCRRRLFHEHQVLTHSPDAAQEHFGARHARCDMNSSKVSTVGASCETVCFLPLLHGPSGEWSVAESGVEVSKLNGTATCGGCGAKIGTAGKDVCCPCGCIISGLTARLAASKLEAPVQRGVSGGLEELLLQAAREREQLLQEELEAAQRGGVEEGGEKKRKEPKKNVKANNRSNFTHFRNKNFAPRQQSESEKVSGGGGGARGHREQ
ncbi:TatD-related deoxyribonuclease [Trypanosoma conorhini]|uniref:TatD-related deoxyribonuclease n=1 Tax=Trypanosoma conorhini TaxID=83891 RepID=A0A3R7NTZ1_9TRYP|nr:TatD-related deoxyribonuclease [Trypanosoma conorhini]RNF26999.1 TatD-related deoxyribonuclease [Trypanosoma conorhini]